MQTRNSISFLIGPGTHRYKLESVNIQGRNETYSELAGPIVLDTFGTSAGEMDAGGLDAALAGVVSATSRTRAERLSAQFSLAASARHETRDARLESRPRVHSESRVASLVSAAAAARDGSNQNLESYAANAIANMRWFSAAPSRGSSFIAAKVIYDKPGLLLIPQRLLPAGFNAERLGITREGRALTALAATAEGIVVFGQGFQDDYTEKDALFLRRTNTPTVSGQVARAQGLFANGQNASSGTPASVTREFHDVYFDFNLRPYTFAPWFSSQYLTDGTTQSFTVDTPHAIAGAASLTVNLWSVTQADGVSPDHALYLLLNGQPAGQTVWSGGNKVLQLSFPIASGTLNNGANQIELVTPALNGVESQISFLHSITVEYERALDGSQPVEVYNRESAAKLFEVGAVPSPNVWVVDARYPDRAKLVPYETQAQPDGTFKLRFNAGAGGTGRYLVVPAGQENLPIAVSKRQVKPIKPAPYVAVGPSQFAPGVQPLLTARSKEGLRGAFVDQEQIFDYYGCGRYGPSAIQNAVRAVRPQYLLLLGRTTYDYRDYSGLNVDPLCPTFLIPTTFWAQATSDSMFGDLGRGYPEVAVGRLPVNDASELSVAIQHILANRPLASAWRIHAVADRIDASAGDFSRELDVLAQSHPDIEWRKNYLGVTHLTAPEVTTCMKAAANGGADLILYAGHGNAVRLGKDAPRILDTNAVQEWTGNVIFLQSTCTANWMAKNETGYKSIAIQALTQTQGGISASIGSSTYVTSAASVEFMGQLLKNASVRGTRWGNALLKTQQWTRKGARSGTSDIYGDLGRTEQLFGDPALPIYAPPAQEGPAANATPAKF